MWFNSTQREEPYQLLTCPVWAGEIPFFGSAGRDTGAAWLSSARVVRCWVKSRNERNPHLQLPAGEPGTQQKLPVTSRRKAGMTSSPHGPYGLGYTRATMAVTEGRPCANLKKPSQFGLLSATREHEVGIASNRGSACRGEYVPGPCTHRPSHHGSWLYPKAVQQPARERADHGKVSDWGEVVTR